MNRILTDDYRLDSSTIGIKRVAQMRWLNWAVALIFLGASQHYSFLWLLSLGALAAIGELWQFSAARPLNIESKSERLRQVSEHCARVFTVCTAVGCIYFFWMAGSEAFRLAAVAFSFMLLFHAQLFLSRSTITLVIGSLVPAGALIAEVLFRGHYHGISLIIASFGPAAGFAYAVIGGFMNQRATKALEASRLEANNANQAKSAFLAMMSHELRTPMNGVLGMAEALKLSPLNEQQLSQVNLLLQSGKGLMSILNDTLDVSKIEAGKMDIEALPVNLEGLCMMTAEVWKSTASAKGLVLACEIDPATPDWVLGDATRLRQIMTNLISNALKFTERGGVTLSLRPLSQADGCVSLELAVSDTGVGLSEIHAARLFQPFAQAETSTARRYGGTGLGLNICKRLAEMMGGDIVLESRLGEGSTFRVTVALPITSDPGFEEEAAPLFDIGGLRILVVDDNATNRAVAVAILGAFGAQVQTANDGLEGLTALRESDFDLVLMDIHMPNLGGEGALVQIRAGETGRAQIPVIAFTADAQASEVERLVDLGFNGVQPKPINPTTLIEAISKISHIALGQTAPSDEIHRPLARLA